MAQTHSFSALHGQQSASYQRPDINSGFVVVNQQPSLPEFFPYRIQVNWILGFSITKCIFGVLLFITGIVNVVEIRYDTKIAFGIWCGLTILANGIIGCILKYKQNKCLIGTFLGLSITSLIFDISMLSFYVVVLEYFANVQRYFCYYDYYRGDHCITILSRESRDMGIGITAFMISMVVLELGCSIGSVVVSCKAYSKCCNTCDFNDCCTCLGCCECDCHPINVPQSNRPNAPPPCNYQNIQMSSLHQGDAFQYNPNQPRVNTNVQNPPVYNVQGAQGNPCSGVVSFIVNMPSYMFGGANGTQMSAFNVTFQPVPSNQQVPDIEQARRMEQVQTATVGDAQQNPPTATWNQVDA